MKDVVEDALEEKPAVGPAAGVGTLALDKGEKEEEGLLAEESEDPKDDGAEGPHRDDVDGTADAAPRTGRHGETTREKLVEENRRDRPWRRRFFTHCRKLPFIENGDSLGV